MESKIDQIKDPRAREFSQDCFDTKSVTELKIPHTPADADSADLNEWNITSEAWSEAMDAALHDLLEEAEYLFQKTVKVDEDIALRRWGASCNTPWGIVTRWGRNKEEALKKLHDYVMGLDARD